ncbi:MAG: hypothetical protein ABSE82_03700 [Nitrososphaerales archaeon]
MEETLPRVFAMKVLRVKTTRMSPRDNLPQYYTRSSSTINGIDGESERNCAISSSKIGSIGGTV